MLAWLWRGRETQYLCVKPENNFIVYFFTRFFSIIIFKSSSFYKWYRICENHVKFNIWSIIGLWIDHHVSLNRKENPKFFHLLKILQPLLFTSNFERPLTHWYKVTKITLGHQKLIPWFSGLLASDLIFLIFISKMNK